LPYRFAEGHESRSRVTTRLLNAELAKIKRPEFANAALEIAKPLDGEPTRWRLRGKPGAGYITNPEACPMFRTLVFLKYGVTFRELVCELEHSPQAFDKWKRVHIAYHKIRWGDGSLDTLKLKFNFTHLRPSQLRLGRSDGASARE
jgi:hypothetical protein